ncbi:LTA synthase family protein [Loigolactobacillus backii]|uniref:LTA synthase family protein n=2 Tax=Loigolactobacillus backii TaxID=375175 RepID=UPI0007F07CE0|nr:alkaline phosphatase family protein [Loigolactobacillus backii]ANK67453.1 hypothetical protein AYR55_06950 [Loigolactobacillus backii]PIO88177.1 hypothetical protein B8A32_03670 [Loigolactobacillus backii]
MQTSTTRHPTRKLGLVLLVGAFFSIFNTLFFSLDFTSLNGTNPSLKWDLLTTIRIGLMPGTSLLLLSFGYYTSGRRASILAAFKSWLYIVGLGTLITSITAWIVKEPSLWTLYDTIFPIMRNSYPLLTGVLLALLIQPQLEKWLLQTKPSYLRLGFLLITLLTTVFNHDIFNFNGGQSFLAAFLLVTVGMYLRQHPLKAKLGRSLIWSGSLFLLTVFLTVLMSHISYMTHSDQSTALRFASPLTINVAYMSLFLFNFLTLLPTKLNFQLKKPQYFILYALLLKSATYLALNLKTLNTNLAGISTRLKGLYTFSEALAFIIAGLLLNWLLVKCCQHGQRWQRWSRAHENWTWVNLLDSIEKIPHQLHQLLVRHKLFFATTVTFYILALGSMLAMNTSLRITPNTALNYNIFLYTFFQRQSIIWLNVLIIASLFFILLVIFNRYWIAFIVTDLALFLWTIANVLKISIRVEPILPSELSMITALGSLAGMITPTMIGLMIGAVILSVGLIIWLEIRHPIKLGRFGVRLVISLLAIVFLASSLFLNHQNSPVQLISTALGNSPMFYNQLVGAQKNGPILQFLNNLDVTVMAKPTDYSKSEIQRVMKRYETAAQQINKTRTTDISKQTVIFNLSESFSDPERVPNMTINEDPMPKIRAIKQQTTSGLMLSSGYGGGTANMEYQTLTGFAMSNFSPTLPTPYTQLVTNLDKTPSVTENFGYSSAIHPYSGVYYNREAVYKKFGFNKFAYLGSKTPIKYQSKIGRSPYLSDETAYKNALAQINSRKGGQFINLITMQNHFPFDKDFYNNHSYKVSGSAVADPNAQKSAEDFATGVHYTDNEVAAFKKKIDKINKPIIWVWYGDHLPGIYSGDDMATDGLALHETDYFIYANKYSRQHGYKQQQASYVGPNDFTAMMLDQANAKVSPYQALLTKIHKELPAMSLSSFTDSVNTYNDDGQFVNQKGQLVTKLTKKQKQLLHDFKLIQYDVNAGKQYSVTKTFLK